MPKVKTKKCFAKRFKFTKSGKIKRAHAFKSHIRTKKTAKRKRVARQTTLVSKEDKKTIRRGLPYG